MTLLSVTTGSAARTKAGTASTTRAPTQSRPHRIAMTFSPRVWKREEYRTRREIRPRASGRVAAMVEGRSGGLSLRLSAQRFTQIFEEPGELAGHYREVDIELLGRID